MNSPVALEVQPGTTTQASILKAASIGDNDTLKQMLPSMRPFQTAVIHTAMCRAASRGHLKAFKTLAKYCDDIHADDPKRATNAIISSVMGDHTEILDFVLANGGDIDRPTRSGRTPVATVIQIGRLDILEVLISRGANVNRVNTEGRTSLCLAATLGRFDLVEMLVHHGAAINCPCHCCCTSGQLNSFHGAVDAAAVAGELGMVSFLLDRGGVHFRDSDLYLSALTAILRRWDEDLAWRLVATNPDINAVIERHEVTPLCLAVQQDDLTLVQFLISCGANINTAGRDGSPLCYAVLKNLVDMTKSLIASGADVNMWCGKYDYAIHAAVEFGYVEMVRILLSNGAFVHVPSRRGMPLDIARDEQRESCTSERGRRFDEIVALLLETSPICDPNQKWPTKVASEITESSSSSCTPVSSDAPIQYTWFDWQ